MEVRYNGTMTNFVRTATIDDLDYLVSWGEKLHFVEKKFEPLLTFSKKESEDFYTKQLNNPDALFLVASIDNTLVGYLYAHVDKVDYLNTNKYECEIEVIYLDEKARGTGISQELIQKCFDWIKTKDCFRVKAGIYSKNIASQNLFAKMGFESYHSTYTKSVV